MNIEIYLERLKDAARRAGFTYSCYGTVGDTALPVLERIHGNGAPEIYVSAGVHGDEPAGPMAVLDLLRRKALPETANLVVFPLVNPAGLVAGTRENPDGIDLNRDYGLQPRAAETRAQMDWLGDRQFNITLCLHEDYDGQGFYIYAHSGDSDGEEYAAPALKAAGPWTGIDPRTLIDEMPAREGRMYPPLDVLDPGRPDLPEALRLHFHHGSTITVTTETPSGQPIYNRVQAQCAAVEAILKVFLERFRP